MKKNQGNLSRRTLVKSSFLGIFIPFLPSTIYYDPNNINTIKRSGQSGKPHKEFPHIDPEIVSEVVGKSHGNFERVKELVDVRPELAKATWEWRFGDWESAIGAASHVGRRDIANYLIEKGARPTIFTFAMLGAYSVVKSMIAYSPGIQTTPGPHGITLLTHAYAGMRMKDKMSSKERSTQQKLIDYLESLGDADGKTYEKVSEENQKKYLGDYKYGEGAKDGFTIHLNRSKSLSLGPIGGFGGKLHKIGDDLFTYNGAPSVTISFEVINDKVNSMTINEPGLTVKAIKIS